MKANPICSHLLRVIAVGAVLTVLIALALTPSWLHLYQKYESERKNELNIKLHTAAGQGDIRKIKSLVAEGANINYYYRSTPLAVSLIQGRWDCAEYLISKGARIDLDNQPGHHLGNLVTRLAVAKPIDSASEARQLTIARYLFGKGVDFKTVDAHGCSPLHWTAVTGSKRLAEELIKRGADVNANARSGATPLTLAAGYGRLEVVKLLLANGADVTVVTKSHRRNALQEALHYKKPLVAKLLREHIKAKSHRN